MPVITGPILDSSGRPAAGFIRVQASATFDVAGSRVTRADGVVTVRGGVPAFGAAPWSLPATPRGVRFALEQDLDGERSLRFEVNVPDVAILSYSQLLFHRGDGRGGANPHWWDLTGGRDFPASAVDGDYGFDGITGEVYRCER